MRDNQQEMILLSSRSSEEDRKSGVKKEVDGSRDGGRPKTALSLIPMLSSSASSFFCSVRVLWEYQQ